MKIRSGFVSNSSSSSFICKLCSSKFIAERGSTPYFCEDCLYYLPDEVEITFSREEIEEINKESEYFPEFFEKIRKEYFNED